MISRADLNFGWIEFQENYFFWQTFLACVSMLIDVCVCDLKGSAMFRTGVYHFLFSSWYSLGELKAEN